MSRSKHVYRVSFPVPLAHNDSDRFTAECTWHRHAFGTYGTFAEAQARVDRAGDSAECDHVWMCDCHVKRVAGWEHVWFGLDDGAGCVGWYRDDMPATSGHGTDGTYAVTAEIAPVIAEYFASDAVETEITGTYSDGTLTITETGDPYPDTVHVIGADPVTGLYALPGYLWRVIGHPAEC